jgi:hypothetical protein
VPDGGRRHSGMGCRRRAGLGGSCGRTAGRAGDGRTCWRRRGGGSPSAHPDKTVMPVSTNEAAEYRGAPGQAPRKPRRNRRDRAVGVRAGSHGRHARSRLRQNGPGNQQLRVSAVIKDGGAIAARGHRCCCPVPPAHEHRPDPELPAPEIRILLRSWLAGPADAVPEPGNPLSPAITAAQTKRTPSHK